MERTPATTWPLRAARSGAVALAAVATSLAGHALAGGAVPSPAALAGFTLLAAALTVPLSALRWTPVRLLGVLALAQGGFHLAFSHLAAPAAGAADLPMAAWHLVATAVTCLLVLRAEAWLWRVLAGLRTDGPGPCPPPAARGARPTGRSAVPPRITLDRALSRRGPPLSVSA